jgi:tRNA-2-methylthio-N6-dimethylallyladenosine synthase
MAGKANVCRFLHIPVQSASNRILVAMKRPYTANDVDELVRAIRRQIPNAGIGCDLMAGFPSESDLDFMATRGMLERDPFTRVHVFPYSERPGTYAHKHLPDNIPEEEKVRRLNEIIALQSELSLASNRREIGRTVEVLVEGFSKRSHDDMFGRTSQYKTVVFPRAGRHIGELVRVRITSASAATLRGELVED